MQNDDTVVIIDEVYKDIADILSEIASIGVKCENEQLRKRDIEKCIKRVQKNSKAVLLKLNQCIKSIQ